MPKSFADLGLSESTLQALADVGYESPSPIQEQAIPSLLAGNDVIGQAQTGTGKTAAFGLPIMEYIDPSESEVQALVLTPTRELCIQVTQALRTYGAHSGIDVVAVFGAAAGAAGGLGDWQPAVNANRAMAKIAGTTDRRIEAGCELPPKS